MHPLTPCPSFPSLYSFLVQYVAAPCLFPQMMISIYDQYALCILLKAPLRVLYEKCDYSGSALNRKWSGQGE